MAHFNSAPQKPLWPFTLNVDSPLARGLIGWWPITPHGRILDLSRYGNHGTLGGTTKHVFRSGPFGGRALSTVAGDSNVAMTLLDAYATTGPISLAAWVLQTATTGSHVVGGTSAEATAGATLAVTTGVPTFSVSTDGSTQFDATASAVTNNVWYHLVGTFDGTDAKIYVNGALAATTATDLPTIDPYANFAIGSTGNAFRGRTSDVMIYNRALSAHEIYTLWAPPTRWSLRYVPGRAKYFFPHQLDVDVDAQPGDAGLDAGLATTLAGTGTTVTAIPGDVGFDAGEALAAAGVLIVCAPGEFGIDSAAAAAGIGDNVICIPGNWNLGTQIAAVTAGATVTVQPGKIGFDARSATISVGVLVVAAPGEFGAWSPTTPTLVAGVSVFARPGDLGVGGVASVSSGVAIVAKPGDLGFSSKPRTFSVGVRVFAQPGELGVGANLATTFAGAGVIVTARPGDLGAGGLASLSSGILVVCAPGDVGFDAGLATRIARGSGKPYVVLVGLYVDPNELDGRIEQEP